MKPPGICAGPPGHPTDRTNPGNPLDRFDAEADMLALGVFGHRLIIAPTIAVADDLVAILDKRAGDLGITRGGLRNGQQTDLDPELAEQAQQPPTADARAVFEDRLDHRTAQTGQ